MSKTMNPDMTNEESKPIEFNEERTLNYLVENYNGDRFKSIIREIIQNAVDGRATNVYDRDILEEFDGLEVSFIFDSDEQTLTVKDNAGGMPQSVFSEDFTKVNQPGQEKIDGDMGGSYGQGFFIVGLSGDKVYAETLHRSEAYSVQFDFEPVEFSTPQQSEVKGVIDPKLDESGTYVRVYNIEDHISEKLEDLKMVRDAVFESFWLLFENYDVTVNYIIDGEEKLSISESPFSFSDYKDDLLLDKSQLNKFSYNGNSGRVKDLKVFETSSFSKSDVPFDDPIAMVKGNKHLSSPYMLVKEYKPQKLRSLRGDNPQMMGVCDVSDLCPEMESPSHFDLKNQVASKTGVKEELNTLQEEELETKQETKEMHELENYLKNTVNEVLAEHGDDIDLEAAELGPDDIDEDNLPPEKESTSDSNTDKLDFNLTTTEFEADVETETAIVYQIRSPSDADATKWKVTLNKGEGPGGVEIPSRMIRESEVKQGDQDSGMLLSMSVDEEGRYEFSAKLESINHSGEKIERTDSTVFVGGDRSQLNEETSGSSTTNKSGESNSDNDVNMVSFVSEIQFLTYTVDNKQWVAQIREDKDDGKVVEVNLKSGLLKWARKTSSSESASKKWQIIFATNHIIRAIYKEQLREKLDEKEYELVEAQLSNMAKLQNQTTEKFIGNSIESIQGL